MPSGRRVCCLRHGQGTNLLPPGSGDLPANCRGAGGLAAESAGAVHGRAWHEHGPVAGAAAVGKRSGRRQQLCVREREAVAYGESLFERVFCLGRGAALLTRWTVGFGKLGRVHSSTLCWCVLCVCVYSRTTRVLVLPAKWWCSLPCC